MENLERNEIISISPQDTQLDLTEDILAAANRRVAEINQNLEILHNELQTLSQSMGVEYE